MVIDPKPRVVVDERGETERGARHAEIGREGPDRLEQEQDE